MTTFDLNAVISAALTAAVEQATQPLVERIAALEARPAVAPDAAFLAQVNDVVRQHVAAACNDSPPNHILSDAVLNAIAAKVDEAIENHVDEMPHPTDDDIDERINDYDIDDKVAEVLDYDEITSSVLERIDWTAQFEEVIGSATLQITL